MELHPNSKYHSRPNPVLNSNPDATQKIKLEGLLSDILPNNVISHKHIPMD